MVRISIACVALLALGLAAAAQTLGSGPIRVIVPVAPGAATDVLGRIAADWISKRTGLTTIVENRTGAGGNIALESVARADPDGHTLLVATNGAITINRALFKKDPIDTLTDVVPVAPLAEFANILVINAKVPARNAQEFIAYAKAHPGAINYGSAGPGTTPHLALALFARLAGIDLVHVPYRGIAPAMTDLVANNVQASAVGYATVAPFVASGAVRVLAVAGTRRLSVSARRSDRRRDWTSGLADRDLVRPVRAARHALCNRPAAQWPDRHHVRRSRRQEAFPGQLLRADAAHARGLRGAGEVRSRQWERIVQQTGVKAE